MANKGDIYKVALPNGDEYNFKDKYVRENYRALNNNDFDTINVTELNSGNIINTGAARFLNTINGSISGNAATASDSAKLNGYASSEANTGNTIVKRTANGYIFATYFNQSSGAETPSSSSYIIYANSDGYFRKSTVANMKTAMSLNNVENKSSATIRGELTSANVTTALGYTPVNKAGDTITGALKFGTNAIPEFSGSPPYILGIEAFANGGDVKWKAASSVSVGYATTAGSATDNTKVAKAGDTMSGTLNFTTTSGISYQGTKATYTMIAFKDNANDNYGNGIVIGGGGLTVVGGGESAGTVAAQYSTGGDEILELVSDGNVYVRTNVQSGYASAKTFTFSTDGSLTATKFIGALQGNADTATKATQDSDGNTINSTYLKLSGGTLTGTLQLGSSTQSTLPTCGIHVHDVRSVAITPTCLNRSVNFFFTNKSTDRPSTEGWSSIMHVQGWNGTENYNSWELLGPAGTGDQRTSPLYVRSSNEGTWGDWRKIYDTSNKPSKSDVGLGNVDNTADANKSVNYATSAGSANTATSATNSYYIVTPDGRSTSADIDLSTVGRNSKMFWCLASGNMTTSSPGEGYITTWSWDWGGYGAQLFMPQNPTQSAKRRCSYVNGTSDWGNWVTLLDSNNYTSYTVKKDGTGASGTWGISITGNAATATSATKATQDESGNNIKASYASSFSISDHTITLKNKNGASLGTVTVPDNNTTYSAGDNMTLSSTTFYATKRWHAVTQGQTWSRILLVENSVGIVGNSGLLHVCCTRGSVVCNATFIINTSHASYGQIHQIGSNNYSKFKIRLLVNSSGYIIVDIYDTANSIASGATQNWYCSYLSFQPATITTYTAFTDDSTIPSEYTSNGEMETVTGNDTSAIRNITRSGTTFTATRQNGTTFTFTQQDSNDQFTLGTSGNSVVLSKNGTAQNTITVPYATSAGSATDNTKLPLAGGTLTGNLTISHATSADMSASSANPKITFAENGSQPVHLIYTDYDNYRSPAGLKVIGGASATPAWFEVEGHVYTGGSIYTSATICANTANSSTAGGLSLYGTDPTAYGVIFRGTGNQGKHGYVTSDWATYFTMSNTNNRGWVFRRQSSGNVASIDTSGQMVLNGSLTLGGNEANTSGVRQVYNANTKSLDFVFVA